MPKLLITGFDPFGGESVNPAWEAVKRLPEEIGDWQVIKLPIPTVFSLASQRTLEAAAKWQPDCIINVGQAGGRKCITPEMVAINLRYGSIADNAGAQPKDEPCVPGGPDAYFTTLPVRRMAEALAREGVPGAVSYSAGAFVCNDTMYRVLHQYAGSAVRAGFIHVPFLPEQGEPSMALNDIVRGLEICISCL